MKLIFNHSYSIHNSETPLIFLQSEKENESYEFMFENGWVPFCENQKEYWYQTKSSRLKINPISNRRKSELNKIKISNYTSNNCIEYPIDLNYYNCGIFEDFFLDDIFWGRIHYYDNQIMYSIMNKTRNKKSYGTLSYYYLLDRFFGKFEYLYISDYFEKFSYKKNLPGFEYWNGNEWVVENKFLNN